jgi:hypothetical protein
MIKKASSRGTTGGSAVRHVLGPAIPWRVAPRQCCLRFTGRTYCNRIGRSRQATGNAEGALGKNVSAKKNAKIVTESTVPPIAQSEVIAAISAETLRQAFIGAKSEFALFCYFHYSRSRCIYR